MLQKKNFSAGSVSAVVRSFSLPINWLLQLFELRLTLYRPASLHRQYLSCDPIRHWYPQVEDCQIKDLSFLLSLFLGERTTGSYVEVGAFDGISFSNTYGLAERGWSGVMIEPVPEFAARCRDVHRNHPGVRVVNVAVGAMDGETLVINLAGPLSSGSLSLVEEYRNIDWARGELTSGKVKVPSMRLDTVLKDADVPEGFDLLVVDVEGFEAQVFSGFDLSRWMPKMMIVELADTHPDLLAQRASDHALLQRLLSKGYGVVYKDGINTIFVRHDVLDYTYASPPGHEI